MTKRYIDNAAATNDNTKGSFTKKALAFMLAMMLTLVLALTACGTASTSDSGSEAVTTASAEVENNAVSKSEMFTDRDLSGDYDESEVETITLNGTSAETSASSGVTVDGSTITISKEGVYVVSGTLKDGQIIVDADDAAKVQIVLKDASITSSDSAALYVKSADKVFVTTAEGTDNTLANGGSFTADGDTNIDGAVFAKDDITFNGSGSLTITSPAGHGVVGKDDVKFGGGTYTITAAKHGVQANDSVRVAESDITITAGDDKDGIHVSDDADAENGTESDSFFYMADGSLTISSKDDGIHADAEVIIEGGTIDITESYEGIEGLSIKISGGKTTLSATDDGLNAAGGNNSSGDKTFGSDDWQGGKGGGFNDGGSDGSIVISGGEIYITAGGDGVDSNGSVEITGGYTSVTGPINGDTSVIDFNSTGTITGGTFIGTGGAGMAENFTSAEQGLIAVTVDSQTAGSTVTLKDSNGDVIAETTPELDYAVVYISTEAMAQGETYTLTAGSYSEEITLSDNIYSNLTGGMHGGGLGGGGPRDGNGMNGNMNGDGQQQMPDGMKGGHGGKGKGGFRGGMPGEANGSRNGGDQSANDVDGISGATQQQGGTLSGEAA
ncbi:MAG: carbohydrate-binding domain-containing protein [Mogibacterium sp.]|nr:carbohydrate-binding domain-containing protein [Mogibacterium sp.]